MESFLHNPTGTPLPCGPCVLVQPRQGVFGLHDSTEPKAPESCDSCTLFSTWPQSFWVLRFNRTLRAREPCGSRTSSPEPRSLLSTVRPNCRTLGPCDSCVLIRPRHEVFKASQTAEPKVPGSPDPCSLFSSSPQSFWALRFNRTLRVREPCGSRTSPLAP